MAKHIPKHGNIYYQKVDRKHATIVRKLSNISCFLVYFSVTGCRFSVCALCTCQFIQSVQEEKVHSNN